MHSAITQSIMTACEASFARQTDNEIAADLGASVSAVSRWRLNEIWQEFEKEHITAHKASLCYKRIDWQPLKQAHCSVQKG